MKKTFYIALCLFAYFLFGMAIVIYSSRFNNIMFVWNAFLAFLPLLFVQLLKAYLIKGNNKRIVIASLLFLWLLFFPNAPYMITDMIYFGNTDYFVRGDLSVTYTTSLLPWIKMIYIGSGILFGALMGLDSLYDVHQIIRAKLSKPLSNAAIVIVCFLSGFAIYIGRILRVNSWDVLRPFSLLEKIKDDLSLFSVTFSFLFSLFVLGMYLIYSAVMYGRKHSAVSS